MIFSLDFDDVKSPSAIDYGDINELAEDFSIEVKSEAILNGIKSEDNVDYDADDEEAGKYFLLFTFSFHLNFISCFLFFFRES